MQYIKRFKRLLTSNYVISFDKTDREVEGLREGDLVRVDVSVIKKCYLCNNCREKIDVDINEDREDSEIVCSHCENTQLLKDSIRWDERK